MILDRIKRQHNKTRSGCVTCKRRRVKCDEGRPICRRCQRANQKCLGYETPAALRPVRKHWPTVPESDYGSIQEQHDDAVDIYGSHDSSDAAITSDNCTSMNQHINYGLRTLEEQRSVQFWLQITAPNMETYGPIRGLYTMLLPQWAHHSVMIKHFMVATALTHEKIYLTALEKPNSLAYRSFHHFQLGLQSLIREQHSKLSRILGSIIAWTFEMMMGNFPAARFHVAASLRLVNELEAEVLLNNDWSSFDSLQYQIKPGLRIMKSYSAAAFDEGNNQINYQEHGCRANSKIQFSTLDDGRKILSQAIEQYCSSDREASQATREFRCFVTAWHLALREHHRTPSETLEQHKATLFLFSVAMALLPENEVGDLSYSTNPAIVCHILANVDGLLHQMTRHMSLHVKARVEITLKAVLETILLNFHDESIQQRATHLLSRIKANESSVLDYTPG